MVQNLNLGELIQIVDVPLETVTEIKDGKSKEIQRKRFPGYVLLKMIMNDETWYVIRNTRGVTSFVGPGSKPVALTDEEVISMGLEDGVSSNISVDIEPGESVLVKTGPFANSTGLVKEVNVPKRTVKVMISVFGRETPMELDFSQVQKLD